MILLWPAIGATAFEDDAGRSVVLPATPERVLAAGHPAAILIYTLDPSRLTGWSRRQSPSTLALLPPEAAELPELGRLTGRGDTANLEVVLRADPDLIVDYGSVTETTASLAERVSARVNRPYLLLDGRFDRIPATYRRLGEALGIPDRGEELAREAERLLARADAVAARVDAAERVAVYYARGEAGLDTGLPGSLTTEVLERVGGRNAAATGGSGNLARVSIEQILRWDPAVVLAMDQEIATAIRRDRRWAPVSAVREERIHVAPDLPFGWFDRPPSVNRLLGLEWLAALLYPDHYDGDLRDEVRRFFRNFYHREPNDAELDALLRDALPE